jgi:hypothetical protein
VEILLGTLIVAGLALSVLAAVLSHRGGMKEDPDDPGFYLLPRHGKKLMWLNIEGAMLAAISGFVALAQAM